MDVSFTPDNSPHSSLSTPPADVDSFYELDQRVSARLESYQPANNGDSAIKPLKLFVKYLPKQGALTLMNDIVAQDGDISLRQLGSNLVDTLLTPCMLFSPRVGYCPPLSSCHANSSNSESVWRENSSTNSFFFTSRRRGRRVDDGNRAINQKRAMEAEIIMFGERFVPMCYVWQSGRVQAK